ncbi:unnamed protein product [Durusdinium trenchii]|uniref:Uncharacterized protein n=1 Tax=Durusdinium trenchii TaxID=1381693 RepID=A0ABP0RBJ2_9DINO
MAEARGFAGPVWGDPRIDVGDWPLKERQHEGYNITGFPGSRWSGLDRVVSTLIGEKRGWSVLNASFLLMQAGGVSFEQGGGVLLRSFVLFGIRYNPSSKKKNTKKTTHTLAWSAEKAPRSAHE